MAKSKPTDTEQSSPTWVQWIKNIAIGKEDSPEKGALANIDLMDVEPTSTAILLGNNNEARSRQQIYAKYQQMMNNSFISAGLRLHVTAALGGHESKGEVLFIECSTEASKDPKKKAIVDEINNDLRDLLNKNIVSLVFNGIGWGDSYARIYSEEKQGVVDLICDEMVLPPLVQPFEQGSRTVGYVVGTATNSSGIKLSTTQMVRVKMPRTVYTPQARVMQKAFKTVMLEDDVNQLPYLPSLVGGSFLDGGVEEAYDNLMMALAGMVGQRIQDGLDEALLTLNMSDMSLEQQKATMTNIGTMLTNSAQQAAQAIKQGRPLLGKLRHLIPIWSEKQLVQVQEGTGSKRSGTISIEDVLFHAKQLSGAIGIDLAMLGFADLLAGGLGEGGFFRVSAQVAERSRMIRTAATQTVNDIIDIHLYKKSGLAFSAKDRPWVINYYSTISALEKERQDTKLAAMNTGGLLIQSLAQLKDLGLGKDVTQHLLSTQMLLDENSAKLVADGLDKAKVTDNQGGENGGF
ncbi:hypothetical protein [Agitococcus lubricus]|uniref:Uncharacterized protein n=1 Tax=Agitococcus lubricus TaxID=1077255 RepID=A0A2T5ITA9_9GAMM|nr:hypothetical protein [Agitococcus lubricus]PTQ87086.1 hypothetical protein C8N29_1248 [Agitococcus lubricus]